jgi:hypothetical protein
MHAKSQEIYAVNDFELELSVQNDKKNCIMLIWFKIKEKWNLRNKMDSNIKNTQCKF